MCGTFRRRNWYWIIDCSDILLGDKMRKELETSTKLLEALRAYCSTIRTAVLNDVRKAMKGGFTYLDLDTLDDISIQVSLNKKALSKRKEKVKNVRS